MSILREIHPIFEEVFYAAAIVMVIYTIHTFLTTVL